MWLIVVIRGCLFTIGAYSREDTVYINKIIVDNEGTLKYRIQLVSFQIDIKR